MARSIWVPLILMFSIAMTSFPSRVLSKFYIESCSTDDKCKALLGYRVIADTKVSNVGVMFGVDTLELLGANNYEITMPNPENVIIQAQEVLRIPVSCACSSGIRKTDSTFYVVRDDGESLSSIAHETFSGMVTPQQIVQANSNVMDSSGLVNTSEALAVGQRLVIPFPCACNGGSFNGIPSIFVSYMVQPGDYAFQIAQVFDSSVSNLVELNSMQESSHLIPGDILEIPIPACTSSFDLSAADNGLMVANGTYAITAGHCVQCSCGHNYPKLDCTPAPAGITASCPSTKCVGANLNIGELSTSASLHGCEVTSCLYNGFRQSEIFHGLQSSNETSCPGPPSPPAYRQYIPAVTPDASPIIEPQTLSSASTNNAPVAGAPSSAVASNGMLPQWRLFRGILCLFLLLRISMRL